MIHVRLHDIEKAYRQHKRIANSENNDFTHSHKMVLFYAVECGLKALFMKQKNLTKTDQLVSSQIFARKFGHDLNLLSKELDLKLGFPQVKTKDNIQIDSKDVHQAWRYGRELDDDDEKKFVQLLNGIMKKLKNEFRASEDKRRPGLRTSI